VRRVMKTKKMKVMLKKKKVMKKVMEKVMEKVIVIMKAMIVTTVRSAALLDDTQKRGRNTKSQVFYLFLFSAFLLF
jgi:hypothetical protein